MVNVQEEIKAQHLWKIDLKPPTSHLEIKSEGPALLKTNSKP
jgi:hypothetical protein